MPSPPDPTAGHSAQHRPLAAYGAIAAAFNGLFAAGLVAARRADRPPEPTAPGELAPPPGATAKLSRLIAKDRVTSVVRAPFTEYEDDSGYGEVEESARGTGLRRAAGE